MNSFKLLSKRQIGRKPSDASESRHDLGNNLLSTHQSDHNHDDFVDFYWLADPRPLPKLIPRKVGLEFVIWMTAGLLLMNGLHCSLTNKPLSGRQTALNPLHMPLYRL